MAENSYPEYFDNTKYNPSYLCIEERMANMGISNFEKLFDSIFEYEDLMRNNDFILWMNGVNPTTCRKIKINARLHKNIRKNNGWKSYEYYMLLREYSNATLPNTENINRTWQFICSNKSVQDFDKIKNVFYGEKYKQYVYRPSKKIFK